MSNTNYIIIIEPIIEKITASNPKEAERKIREKRPEIKKIMIVPRSAVKLDGKRITAF